MKHTLALLLACTVLMTADTGCSKKSTPAPVPVLASDYPTYQYYSVLYNKSTNTTSISAELRLQNEQGEYIYPRAEDSVLFANGRSISSVEKSVFSGMSDLSVRFSRKNMNFDNTASLTDISDISFSAGTPSEISLNATITFTWDGPPLESNEEAEIEFQSLSDTNSASTIGLSGNTIILNERTRPSFGTGPCKMTIRRIKYLPLPNTDGTAGGKMKIRLAVERNVLLK